MCLHSRRPPTVRHSQQQATIFSPRLGLIYYHITLNELRLIVVIEFSKRAVFFGERLLVSPVGSWSQQISVERWSSNARSFFKLKKRYTNPEQEGKSKVDGGVQPLPTLSGSTARRVTARGMQGWE